MCGCSCRVQVEGQVLKMVVACLNGAEGELKPRSDKIRGKLLSQSQEWVKQRSSRGRLWEGFSPGVREG